MRTEITLTDGDIVEFDSLTTGQRLTAEVLLVSFGKVLLDLNDDRRPVLCAVADLACPTVFRPEASWAHEYSVANRHLALVG